MRSVKRNLKIVEENGKALFWSLMCLLLLTASLYVYLVNTAALHGVRWTEGDEEMTRTLARISELESEYFALKQSVTLRLAYEKGFEDVRNITFINAEKVGAVSSINEI